MHKMGRVKRIWYLSPMRAAKVQASLLIRTVSPEPPLLAHTSSESRGTFRQKARSLAPLNGWACAVKICQDGMLEDTNSLDAVQMIITILTKLYAISVSSGWWWQKNVWAASWQNQQSGCAPSEDSDRPGHPLGAQPHCWFCHVAAHLCGVHLRHLSLQRPYFWKKCCPFLANIDTAKRIL